jgi:metal-dependent amidase/aminoacylase/carboxypeptidase family protein
MSVAANALNSQHLQRIAWLTEGLRATLVDTRRDLAMYPELSSEEVRTASRVAERLGDLGLEVRVNVGGYGVVGLLRGAYAGPTVALRADMDALPIEDVLDTPYRSQIAGVKHACGHDAHTAIALGVAEVLTGLRDILKGSVKFIFQPAEEMLEGARGMIADGALAHPCPDAIFAWHVFPMPVGWVGYTPGRCFAGMDEFLITLQGLEKYIALLKTDICTALTHLNTHLDPRDAASLARTRRTMMGLDTPEATQALRETVLLSCWPDIYSGTAAPHQILGLMSFPSVALRARTRQTVRDTLDTLTAAHDVTYDLRYTFSNPITDNDPALTLQARPVIEAVVGAEKAVAFKTLFPFSHEDFALYLDEIPGSLFWLGAANAARGIDAVWHTPEFDLDEAALVVGTKVMAAVLVHFLDTFPTSTMHFA